VLIKNYRQWDNQGNVNLARTQGIWGGQVPGKKIYDFMTTPVKPVYSLLDAKLAGRIKLVSAGIRLFKTSSSITEAGTIRVAYKPRGGAPQTSLDRTLETGATNQHNIKLYPSQSAKIDTRAGFLCQVNYRPCSLTDVDYFADIV